MTGHPGDAQPETPTDTSSGAATDAPTSTGPQESSAEPWLVRLRALQAIAQEGVTYSRNPFDTSRYERLRELAADMAQALDVEQPSPIRVAVEAETGYLTPKLDVRAAVHDEQGRILLVRETSDGRWTPPGGWADVGQTLGEGAVREVFEESGYVVEVDRLLGVYDRERWGHPPMTWYTLKAVVACRLVGGTATPSIETDAVGWFGRDEIPELSVPRFSPRLMARVFEHHDDPTLPPDIA